MRFYHKKVVENSVIDDMLLKVTDCTPWYANIVNFMVAGYVPPGLVYESRHHLWDDLYLYKVCADG